MVISLYKGLENDTLSDLHQKLDALASYIKDAKRNVFFFFEFSKAGEAPWKYLKGILKEMNFIELREKNLTNKESKAFIDMLAHSDGVKDSTSLINLLDEASYSVENLERRRLHVPVYMQRS